MGGANRRHFVGWLVTSLLCKEERARTEEDWDPGSEQLQRYERSVSNSEDTPTTWPPVAIRSHLEPHLGGRGDQLQRFQSLPVELATGRVW